VTAGFLVRAARLAIGSPGRWPIGLAGFLARGGIVPFALPIVVLPSVVGLTTFIGPTSISAAGIAPRFSAIAAAAVVIVAGWVVLGTLAGVAADRALVLAALPEGDGRRESEPGLARLLAVRLISLAPFGVALAVAGVRLGQVAYQELILPSDAVRPVVVRVLADAPEAVALLLLGWLASESIGAIAIRRLVLGERSIARALAGAAWWPVRHPIRWLALTVVPTLGSLVVVGPVLIVAAALWSADRAVLFGPADPSAILGQTAAFVAIWSAGLALAGIAAVWRSTAWSLATTEDHRGGGPLTVAGGTL